MTIKLIAIDIDGTLLNSHHQITPEVKAALQKAEQQGVKIVLCTGRPLTGVAPLIDELGLDKEGDYVITYNGSLVQNSATKEQISMFGLSYDDFLTIEMTARKLGIHLHTETEEAIYTANRDISPYTIHEAFLVNMPLYYRTPEEMTPDLNIIKMMMIDEPELLDNKKESIPSYFFDKFNIVRSSPFFLEILNNNVSKGNALIKLAEHLDIKLNEIMAIGDNENDLSMLKIAGISVGMKNSNPHILKYVDYITKSNDEHGVAHAIYNFLENKNDKSI